MAKSRRGRRGVVPIWARVVGVLVGVWVIVAIPAIAAIVAPAAGWVALLVGAAILIAALFPSRQA